jgi:hypothetical protein
MALALLAACAGSPSSKQNPGAEQDAAAAAEAALAAMDGGGSLQQAAASGRSGSQAAASGAASGTTAAAPQTPAPALTSPGSNAGSRTEPAWVTSPDLVYTKSEYVAAVGHGGDRTTAEKNALAAITSLFGQRIQSEQVAATHFSQAVLNGTVSSWSEDTTLTNAIRTYAELDTLVGAEIGDYWYDNKTTHYAVAVMDKAKTAVLYADLIKSNLKIISLLTTMTDAEKYTLDGYSRYQFAGTVADVNRTFANVLTIVGSANTGVNPEELKKGDDYRLEAANITKNIPITIQVKGDRSNRVQGAFASAINKQGFKSGGTNSRYVLDAVISFDPVELANQNNKFVRYVVDANLKDTRSNAVLLPYNINGREGHLTIAEAENRAVVAAEKKIQEAYGTLLQDYLSTLLPPRR